MEHRYSPAILLSPTWDARPPESHLEENLTTLSASGGVQCFVHMPRPQILSEIKLGSLVLRQKHMLRLTDVSQYHPVLFWHVLAVPFVQSSWKMCPQFLWETNHLHNLHQLSAESQGKAPEIHGSRRAAKALRARQLNGI